jgi:hypothetical protein
MALGVARACTNTQTNNEYLCLYIRDHLSDSSVSAGVNNEHPKFCPARVNVKNPKQTATHTDYILK